MHPECLQLQDSLLLLAQAKAPRRKIHHVRAGLYNLSNLSKARLRASVHPIVPEYLQALRARAVQLAR